MVCLANTHPLCGGSDGVSVAAAAAAPTSAVASVELGSGGHKPQQSNADVKGKHKKGAKLLMKESALARVKAGGRSMRQKNDHPSYLCRIDKKKPPPRGHLQECSGSQQESQPPWRHTFQQPKNKNPNSHPFVPKTKLSYRASTHTTELPPPPLRAGRCGERDDGARVRQGKVAGAQRAID